MVERCKERERTSGDEVIVNCRVESNRRSASSSSNSSRTGEVRTHGVPLESRNIRNLEEEPLQRKRGDEESARRFERRVRVEKSHLSRLVLEAGLVEPDLHSSSGVKHDLDDIGLPSSSNLSVHSLSEVLGRRDEKRRREERRVRDVRSRCRV